MKQIPAKTLGFTLMEMVIVILIIGILAVVVVPSSNPSDSTLEYQARQVLNDIRYTQALSMATGQRYRWVRTSSSTYQILDSSGTAIALPNGGTTLTLTSGITFGSLSNLPSNLVVFDSFGVPYTDTSTPGTALASTASIPLSNGTLTRSVTITANTGYEGLS